ncbi:MAG TPA: ABC transporter ATP-binding protein [Chromatiales bacterium]|nr:ABC transporter ATP-binding protein [Chromatiales bacterium]
MATPALRVRGLRKTYGHGATAVHALRAASMEVMPGEVVGLLGASGSGKTTLLHCLGAVIDPSGGRIELGGEVVFDDGWRIADRRTLRRDRIGFVFQHPHLIPFLDALENVALLPMLQGRPRREAEARAMALLRTLGVAERAGMRVEQLSGGQQQRVAIARALANRPAIVLADEPTAPLDSQRALAVMALFREVARAHGTAFVVVTHDEAIIPTFRRIFRLRDGVLHEEAGEGRPLPAAEPLA